MRKVYVYDRTQGKVVERSQVVRADGPVVIPDIKEFQSPIDDSMITSRSDLRRHNRTHGVEQCGRDHAVNPKPPEFKTIADSFAREFVGGLSSLGY